LTRAFLLGILLTVVYFLLFNMIYVNNTLALPEFQSVPDSNA